MWVLLSGRFEKTTAGKARFTKMIIALLRIDHFRRSKKFWDQHDSDDQTDTKFKRSNQCWKLICPLTISFLCEYNLINAIKWKARNLEIECSKLIYTLLNYHEIAHDNYISPRLVVGCIALVDDTLRREGCIIPCSSQLLLPKWHQHQYTIKSLLFTKRKWYSTITW